MTFADELAEIAAKVAVLKEQMNIIVRRQINHQGDHREQSGALGRLQGECLSLRLSMLYKIEEHWPDVLAALRSRDIVKAPDA